MADNDAQVQADNQATPAATGDTSGDSARDAGANNEAQPSADAAQVTPTATGEDAAQGGSQAKMLQLTQDQLDRIIGQRISKVEERYQDYDDIKARLQEIEDAEKTEAERLGERLAQLQAERDRIAQRMTDTAIKSAVVSAASKAGFVDPSDAYALVDMADITIDDDGQVTGAEEAVTLLKEQKPHLCKRAAPQVRTPNPDRESSVAQRTDDQRRREYFGGLSTGFFSPNEGNVRNEG